MAADLSTLTHHGSSGRETHRFTVQQYHAMIESGLLGEQCSVELIRGELVQKMVIGNRHAACVNSLNRLLSAKLSESELISIQNPISIQDSEPEPDVAVLVFCDDLYASRRPTAADVRLLIEVADTSLAYDRDVKMPLYAEAGIVEYWIVNLISDTVEVHRDARSDGRYGTILTMERGQCLTATSFTTLSLSVDQILGPPAPAGSAGS